MRKLAAIALVLFLSACSTVPITGRKQLNLLPESDLIGMSVTQYDQFLSQATVLPDSDARTQQVKRVGAKIEAACKKFMKSVGKSSMIKNFQWEYNVVDDPTINAWCMPGGKIVFYTGILPICETDEGVAVVMGHEIAHAVARHGNERMSQQMGLQMGGAALSVALSQKPAMTQDLFNLSYGVGSQLGSLAFSRKHETEADKMGLVFMTIAGYDPNEAVDFWQRMSSQGGGKPPELLSTHPADDRRVADLREFIPNAKAYANSVK